MKLSTCDFLASVVGRRSKGNEPVSYILGTSHKVKVVPYRCAELEDRKSISPKGSRFPSKSFYLVAEGDGRSLHNNRGVSSGFA